MASIFDQMLDHETGEINEIVLAEAAFVRAANEFRSPNFPLAYLCEAYRWCRERAETMQRVWRQHKGLPPLVAPIMVMVPSWGASGDSFSRR